MFSSTMDICNLQINDFSVHRQNNYLCTTVMNTWGCFLKVCKGFEAQVKIAMINRGAQKSLARLILSRHFQCSLQIYVELG